MIDRAPDLMFPLQRWLAATAIFAGSGLLLLGLLAGEAGAEPVSGAVQQAEASAPQRAREPLRPTPIKRAKRVLPLKEFGGY